MHPDFRGRYRIGREQNYSLVEWSNVHVQLVLLSLVFAPRLLEGYSALNFRLDHVDVKFVVHVGEVLRLSKTEPRNIDVIRIATGR